MMLILFLNHIGVKSLLWTNGSAVADKKIPRNFALIAVRLNPSSIYPNPTITFGLAPAERKTQEIFVQTADKGECRRLQTTTTLQ